MGDPSRPTDAGKDEGAALLERPLLRHLSGSELETESDAERFLELGGRSQIGQPSIIGTR